MSTSTQASTSSSSTSARDRLGELLSALTITNQFACGGNIPASSLPKIRVGNNQGNSIQFPLNESVLQELKQICHPSEVGIGTEHGSHGTAVNLDARRSFELKPSQLDMEFKNDWMKGIIRKIQEELGCESWEVSADFYKLLIYEPGCYFRRELFFLLFPFSFCLADKKTYACILSVQDIFLFLTLSLCFLSFPQDIVTMSALMVRLALSW